MKNWKAMEALSQTEKLASSAASLREDLKNKDRENSALTNQLNYVRLFLCAGRSI